VHASEPGDTDNDDHRQQLEAAIAAQGVPLVQATAESRDGLPGPSDWVMLQDTRTMHKVYVQRGKQGPGPIETTLPIDPRHPLFAKDMTAKNGKITCRLHNHPDLASFLASQFDSAAASGHMLPASRAPKARASGPAPAAFDPGLPVD
jgi:hypothetical protein